MTAGVRHPAVRLALYAAVLAVSIGAARAVYVGPREREAAALRAKAATLTARLDDLERGVSDLAVWSSAHPGESAGAARGRQAPPGRLLVPAFLTALEPIAGRHGIATESIEPVGGPVPEVAPDPTGAQVSLVRQSLKFRLRGTYRDLAEYVRDVDDMSAFVVARSVTLRLDPAYPALQAEVRFDLYGGP